MMSCFAKSCKQFSNRKSMLPLIYLYHGYAHTCILFLDHFSISFSASWTPLFITLALDIQSVSEKNYCLLNNHCYEDTSFCQGIVISSLVIYFGKMVLLLHMGSMIWFWQKGVSTVTSYGVYDLLVAKGCICSCSICVLWPDFCKRISAVTPYGFYDLILAEGGSAVAPYGFYDLIVAKRCICSHSIWGLWSTCGKRVYLQLLHMSSMIYDMLCTCNIVPVYYHLR